MLRVPAAPDEQPSASARSDFARLVRDALRHLHDPVSLQTHPLTRLLPEPNDTRVIAGKRLHQLLVDAIGALEPGAGAGDAQSRRRYDLLTLRYVEALEISEVSAKLAISRREYNREHRQALDAVVALLEETAARSRSPSLPLTDVKITTEAPAATGIPPPVTSFIGREQEIAEVLRLLDTVRLVTLSGPPGSGKTRLALQVVGALASATDSNDPAFRDGVSFVALASILDPELVVSAIARALGVREAPNRSLIELLAERLIRRHALLILDNFEHVLDAAPVVSHLLASCPQLTVLVTSRASLRLSGEHDFIVPPLGMPEGSEPAPLEQIARSDAVRLYVDRARAAHSGFSLTDQNALAVAEICRRLDGLPLAIELAAARSKIFPPYALLGRLSGRGDDDYPSSSLRLLTGGRRDVPTRQRTLRRAIDWSYRLLPADEQQLLAQLSVFAGGWRLEAAEAVCATHGDLDVVEGVASLVDKSLVQQREQPDGSVRFGMLETIREFAREQLDALGEEARTVRRLHAEYFLAAARQADAHFWGHERAQWLGRLNHELDNLRAALAWSQDSGELELALHLGGALFWFWHDGGHWAEGRVWLQRALAAAPPGHRTEGRAAALSAAGLCNWFLGDFSTATAQSEECLAIFQDLGDSRGMGRALHGLGVLAADRGDLTRAGILIEEGLVQSQAAEDRPFVGLALHQLGRIAVHMHDEVTARSRIEQSRHVWQDLGSPEALSLAASSLGDLARASGQYAAAAAYYRESLELIGEGGPPGWRADALHTLGYVTHRQGDDREARKHFAKALVLRRERDDQRGMAESVAALACLIAGGQPHRAARLLGSTAAAAEAMGYTLIQSNRDDRDLALTTARSRLGDDVFDSAWRQGRSLTLERAVVEALEESSMPP